MQAALFQLNNFSKSRILRPGPESREEMEEILTEQQLEALKKAISERGRRRFQHMVEKLEEAGCPLTDEQLELLKSLKPRPGMRKKISEILTEEQSKALEN